MYYISRNIIFSEIDINYLGCVSSFSKQFFVKLEAWRMVIFVSSTREARNRPEAFLWFTHPYLPFICCVFLAQSLLPRMCPLLHLPPGIRNGHISQSRTLSPVFPEPRSFLFLSHPAGVFIPSTLCAETWG